MKRVLLVLLLLLSGCAAKPRPAVEIITSTTGPISAHDKYAYDPS